MSSKEEKQNRKKLLHSLRMNEKESKIAQMPISTSQLKELFDYLDENLEENGCQHSLVLTEAYLKENSLPVNSVISWLNQYGGYCDCEVLANVEDHFEDLL
ncbi:DUF2695 domain-containing protein [Dyadobacter sp. 3J3]|uniref:DUF2695 domain-containing protein n=1 Tax=Dyadobacter sp. 3J3 TaxID=2606600 RepID=UPI0013590886|nr:DUF2695 domain-containing protein [Dyadobacter sp. 3J3]